MGTRKRDWIMYHFYQNLYSAICKEISENYGNANRVYSLMRKRAWYNERSMYYIDRITGNVKEQIA